MKFSWFKKAANKETVLRSKNSGIFAKPFSELDTESQKRILEIGAKEFSKRFTDDIVKLANE